MNTLDELFDVALEHATECLIGSRDGQVLPTFWVQHDPGPGKMITAPWDGELEKAMTRAMIRLELQTPTAHSYAFACEAWVATEDARRPTHFAPSEHPDRREVVLIEAFTRYGKGGAQVYAIRRNRQGVVTALEREGRDEGMFKGRLHNLFRSAIEAAKDDEDPTPDFRVRRHKATEATTTRTPKNHCLDCGKLVDAASPVPGAPDSTPAPGDIAICFDCAHIMAYGPDLRVRALTDEEVVEIAGDQEIVEAVNNIVAFNKAHPR